MSTRIGFIGLSGSGSGWAAWMLAPPLLEAPLSASYTLSAVSNSSPASAAASAEKYSKLAQGAVKAYSGPASAIAADPDVDMVAVVVRTPIHKELAMPVIDAGKSLFVEWPAGRGLKETSELAAAAKKQGIRAMVGMQGRQSPVVNKVKSIIESGEIGAVLSTSVMARCPCEPLFAWGPHVAERTQYTADAAEGASFLAVSVGHFLDLFTYTLGPFASVSATIVNQFPTAELVDPAGKPISKQVAQTSSNQVAFAGTLKRGTVVSMHWRGGLPATPKPDLPFVWTIDGEKGSIRIQGDLPYIHIIEPKLYLNGEEVVPEQDGLTNPARAWAEFAKGPSGSYATLDDAVANKTLLAAIERSAEEGKRIDL